MASKATPRSGASAKPKRPWSEREGKVVTPEEAADYLAVTERQVRRLHYDGQLPHIMVGGLLRFLSDDLDAYIERRRYCRGSDA